MITIKTGDIFETDTEAITVPVNTVGVMGKSLALSFKKKHLSSFIDYVKRCRFKELQDKRYPLLEVGKPYLTYLGRGLRRNYSYALIFPTKKHWKRPSKIEYIKDGFKYIDKKKILKGIESIAFPMLGAGLGKLDKQLIIKTIFDAIRNWKIDITIYVDSENYSYAKGLATRRNKKNN